MRIVELEAQPNCVLSIVGDDGRVGRLMSARIYSMRRSRRFETRPNLRGSSMAGTLSNGIVGPTCQRTRSRRGGRWLEK